MVETDPIRIAAKRDRLAKIYRSQPSLSSGEVRAAVQRHMRQSGMLSSDGSLVPSELSLATAAR